MMCPDHGAVDHVGGDVALHHFSQRFQHRVEHASCNPAPIAAEHAVPLAVFVWQMSPLRACPRNPHHAFEIEAVILRRPATSTMFRRQKCTDDRPLVVRQSNPLAQRGLQKTALNQGMGPLSTFVHET